MSNDLTPTELKLAAILLDMASTEFDVHRCDDLNFLTLEFLSLEERQQVLKAIHKTMLHLSDRLKAASEKIEAGANQ